MYNMGWFLRWAQLQMNLCKFALLAKVKPYIVDVLHTHERENFNWFANLTWKNNCNNNTTSSSDGGGDDNNNNIAKRAAKVVLLLSWVWLIIVAVLSYCSVAFAFAFVCISLSLSHFRFTLSPVFACIFGLLAYQLVHVRANSSSQIMLLYQERKFNLFDIETKTKTKTKIIIISFTFFFATIYLYYIKYKLQ